MAPTDSLETRVVLVTGAAKRLGREIALACAKNGWRVAVHYRGSEEDAIKTVALCADSMPASGLKGFKNIWYSGILGSLQLHGERTGFH